jgi:hypothetical protein
MITYFQPNHRLFAVKLSGPPRGPVVGPSVFSDDCHYVIHALWDKSERERWEKHKADLEKEAEKGAFEGTPPYTKAELAWLKREYGNEYKFLLSYGLKIFNDDDREEGRAILRGLMRVDENGNEDTTAEDAMDEGA